MTTGRRLTGDRLLRIREMVRAEQPLCIECHRLGIVRGWDELDHVIPLHLGGTDERDNLQGLCTAHHCDKTRQDMGYRATGACGPDGIPVDPAHHWQG